MGNILVSLSDYSDKNVAYFPANFSFAKKLQLFASQAQDFYLKPAIGAELLRDLKAYTGSPADANYDLLLDGGEYTIGNTVYSLGGIKEVVCFYSYALYIEQSTIQETVFGAVNKESDYSERINNQQIALVKNRCMEMAKESLDAVINYLSNNTATWAQFSRRNNFMFKTKIKAIGD